MKIASWNVNGIRAVERKGALQEFLDRTNPDLLFLQETKAKPEQLSAELTAHSKYQQFYHSAEKPGYAGTSIWIKKDKKDPQFSVGMPDFEDTEGRIVRVDFDNWAILGIYFPNGGKSKEAWIGKIAFYEKFLQYTNSIRAEGKKVIWCGDVNCAHEEIDLARPKENKKSIGFLPEEREWVTKVIKNNWIDVFRSLHPTKVIYSWWAVITRARDRNVGWRIDYFFIDKSLMSQVKKIDYLNAQMGSDHCPVILEI